MKRAKVATSERTGEARRRRMPAARRVAAAVVVLAATAGAAVRAIPYASMAPLRDTAKEIHETADLLERVSNSNMYDSAKIDSLLTELKTLVSEYEQAMVFVESPYPGEVYLGTTPPGDSTWLEVLCSSRYAGLYKEIRIRRTGNRASYLRINDIEIYSGGPRAMVKEVYNRGGRVKLYRGGMFQLALAKPTAVRRIRININHESTGLEVYGVPYEPFTTPGPAVGPVVGHGIGRGAIGSHIGATTGRAVVEVPGKVLLGTTPGGKSTWLETICDTTINVPVRQIELKRTGNRASYLRINDIEITYLTPTGPKKMTFNEQGRAKLYRSGVFTLSLPRPMRVTRIRVLIDHESTGLEVYGVR